MPASTRSTMRRRRWGRGRCGAAATSVSPYAGAGVCVWWRVAIGLGAPTNTPSCCVSTILGRCVSSQLNSLPRVGVVMGSRSDWETMEHAAETLDALDVAYEVRVVSAHRTPDLVFEYASTAADRGLAVIVAGAGG